MTIAVLLAGCGLAMQVQPESEALAHVRENVAGTLTRLSSYMCRQTVERSEYALAGNRPKPCAELLARKDRGRLLTYERLRLDVGSSKSGEIYSWAGEKRFDDRTLFEIVAGGAMSNGNFAGLLSMIFFSDPVRFSFTGARNQAGRRLEEFAFGVPRERSHYNFKDRLRVVAGYEGTLLVDSQTNDPVELVIRTTDLTPDTGACEADSTLDYRRVPINGAELLLPAVARLAIVDTDGSEKVNRTVFSNCHEFLGQSRVSFDDLTGAPPIKTREPPSAGLPPPERVRFTVALAQDIDTARAAAGDAVRAQLATAIKDGANIWAIAGTPLTARLMEVKHFHDRDPWVRLGLRLESIDLHGTTRTFRAHPVIDSVSFHAHKNTNRQWSAGSDDHLELGFPEARGSVLVRKGMRTEWLTGP